MMAKKTQDLAGDRQAKKTEKKELEEAIESITERFGEGTIMTLKEVRAVDVNVIPTGSIALDLALGVGGVPRGRVIEIFGSEATGKTTLALHIIAEAQKKGGVGAFIDAEHALDPDYARRIGVKVDNLLITQPDSGEQALQIVETLVRSGKVDVIVVDSVAALTPKVEIEGEIGDQHIGLQARLMSQTGRKLASIVSKSKTVVIFLNQTRMKIGMVFGCFSYDSKVVLSDGSKKRIGDIVNKKLPVNVLSYNFEKERIEPQKVIDWHKNGKTDFFLQFFVQNHTGNGRRGFSCTGDHKIYTTKGWKRAKDLKVGDKIFSAIKYEKPSKMQEQILIGSILGDGNLKKNHEQTAYFREEHGFKQTSYINWLGSALGSLTSNVATLERKSAIAESRHLLYFGDLFGLFYPKGKKIIPEEIVEKINPCGLAMWYCGDGSIQYGKCYWKNKEYLRKPRAALYVNGFVDESDRNRIIRIFNRFGLKPTLRKVENTQALQFSVKDSSKFFRIIAPYVPASMYYKIPVEFHNLSFKILKQKTLIKEILRPMEIKAIKKRIPYKNGAPISGNRFDISVDNNHNYFVDNCLVSNSPETTPGGLALKFYSSVRINLVRTAQIKSGDEIIGNRVRAKIVKNKVAAPFKVAEFDIYYNEGISKAGDILRAGITAGVIKQSGNTYQFGQKKIGVGLEAAKKALRENPELMKEIKTALLEQKKEQQ